MVFSIFFTSGLIFTDSFTYITDLVFAFLLGLTEATTNFSYYFAFIVFFSLPFFEKQKFCGNLRVKANTRGRKPKREDQSKHKNLFILMY